MANPIFDFHHLTAEERVQLAEDLWDSLAEFPEPLPLTGGQAEELDRRVEEYRRDGNPGTPWAEALDEIEQSRP
jgi:putative addiction module component (TIGR02574 family)